MPLAGSNLKEKKMKKLALLIVLACLTSGCAAMDATCFAWSSAKVAWDLAEGIHARQSKYVTTVSDTDKEASR